VMHVLQNMKHKSTVKDAVSYEFLSGTYRDGSPYNGAIAQLNNADYPWDFTAVTAGETTRTVPQFIRKESRQPGKKAKIAWNGGYILNPELVGKLGLPEEYIGSPLGMLVSDGRMKSAPLFNKPALLFNRDGNIVIRRVNCSAGLHVEWNGGAVDFSTACYNIPDGTGFGYYDLLFPGERIPGNGRVMVRLAGDCIKEIIRTGNNESIQVVPVGLVLAFNQEDFPDNLLEGAVLKLSIPGFEEVLHAVEAGPLLLEKGEVAIDMKKEGWKTENSIRTQAARLDYTDMRGPKIAVGIHKNHQLVVLTVNGRIRESVGATHHEMAGILKELGIDHAMGFDPGGSATLVVNGKTLNISPYNKHYETDGYALPPEPRAVSNAIIGFTTQ